MRDLKDEFISWSLLCSTVAFSDFSFEAAAMAWEVLTPRQELGRHRHSEPGCYRLVKRRHGSSLSRSGGPNHCGPNPAWDNGMAPKVMWKDILARAFPDNDWHKNPLGTQYCQRQTPFTPPVRANGYVWLPQSFDPGPAFCRNNAHTNQTVRS